MALTLPRLLRRLGADLGHFQYALPLALPCPAVVTIHDLSFEREPSLMSRKDRLVFRKVVPRAARKAVRVLTVSERTRRDLRELYDVPDEKIVVTPNGVDPAFTPGDGPRDYVLLVGAVQERKNPLAGLAAAEAAGLPLVVAGPAKDEALALELERRGARVTGYVDQDELVRLYRGAACLVQPVALRGFRAAGAGGDGQRHARGRRAGARPAGGGRRGRRLGRGASSSATASAGRSPSVSGSSRPGSNGHGCSPGGRRRAARSRSTGRRWADEGLRGRRLARPCVRSSSARCPCWRRRSMRWSSSRTCPAASAPRPSVPAWSRTRGRSPSPPT